MKLSTDQFSYDAKTKVFSAEISDFGQRTPFSRLYIDACDEGIWLTSHRTGKTIRFYIAVVEHDRNEDIQSWGLLPVKQDVYGTEAEECIMKIFND